MTDKVTLQQLNSIDIESFTKLLGGIFEHSPWVAEQVAGQRPFESVAQLHAAMVSTVEAAGVATQLALIKAHPELAGKAAVKGELTDESTKEQSGAGLNQCSPEEFAQLQKLNDDYNAKFGFPFIVAVRGHTRHSIIALFADRLKNSPEREMAECLQQIYKISGLRLHDLVV